MRSGGHIRGHRFGGLTAVRAVNRFKDEMARLNRLQTARSAALRIPIDAPKKVTESGVEVQGLGNCLTKFSRCCCPVPGDEIIGFITKGFGVSVHRRDCVNVVEAMTRDEDKGRWVDVNWANAKDQLFETRLQIFSKNKEGLVLDIVTALNAMKAKVASLNARNLGSGNAEVSISVSVTGLDQLRDVMSRIQRVNGIMEVRRMNS